MFYPDKPAIGEPLIVAGDTWRIVGIIADVVDRRLDAEHRPFAYVPQVFNPAYFSIVARTSLKPMQLVADMRRQVERLDPGVAIANPRALDEAMAGSMTDRRTLLTLVGTFAGGALSLAWIGLYGVMAYSVATRRREICIRMALGAARRDVVRTVLGDGLRLTTAGLTLGVVGALGAARLLGTQLFQVHPYDPLVLAGTIGSVTIVALMASYLPAWRATGFDPIAALRNE
jgi:ABC-type antimicrobial peptide transport system permease subunit